MQDACIAPAIYNSWQSDSTKCGGRNLLADVNCAVFIPRTEDDKGSSVLLFDHTYFTCDTQSYPEFKKRQLQYRQFLWKSKMTLLY
jgi:hypothetical protein